MGIIKTGWDSRDSGRLRKTHETQSNYWGLTRLMRLIETSGDLWDSDYSGHCDLWESTVHSSLWVSWVSISVPESDDSPWVTMILISIITTQLSFWVSWVPSCLWVLLFPSNITESHESPLVSLSLMIPHESMILRSLMSPHGFCLMSLQQYPWVSWVPRILYESHESPVVSLSLISLH